MGVQQFYLWLVRRYPMIVKKATKSTIPRTDHLYLDVNGILHRCSKDESVLFKKFVQGKSMKQIIMAILDYMDYLVKVVRPRKSLFIAIDGVAPRAKMTSQKKERYKKQKTDKSVDEFLKKILGNENDLLEFKTGTISPGTEFMCKLRTYIDFYIKRKFSEDPFWKKLSVVFSGGDVPGEGEHKILEYIRRMKQTKEFNMSESHCIYSNDADLIMLSLATHLPYVSILRESMQFNRANVNLIATRKSEKPPLEFLFVNLLREYIDMEYRAIQDDLPAPYTLERIIDDWVLLCFFIGNDFLRKIYCLNIKKGNFDEIIEIFKRTYRQTRDYSMREGHINWDNFFFLLKNISQMEMKLIQGAKEELTDYAKEIHDTEKQAIERLMNQEREMENEAERRLMELPEDPHLQVMELPNEESKEGEQSLADLESLVSESGATLSINQSIISEGQLKRLGEEEEPAVDVELVDRSLNEESRAENIEKEEEKSVFDEFAKSFSSNLNSVPPKKEHKKNRLTTQFRSEVVEKEKNFVQMIEKLYYEGNPHEAKKAYYKRFFGFDIDEEEGQSRLRTVVKNYLEGIQFVISYYYEGCPSWTWYNKYALSPFLTDVVEFLENFGQEIRKDYEFEFEYSAPAEPFLQLLLILSPESSSLLPPEFRGIMNSPDSPAIMFYPTEFEMTPLDTKLDYAWLPLLPPVDDKIIENEYKRVKDEVWSKLSPEVQSRNRQGMPFKYTYNPKASLNVKIVEEGLFLDEFSDFTSPVELSPFDYMAALAFDKSYSKHSIPKGMRQNQHFPSFERFGLSFHPRLIQKRSRVGVAYHVMVLEGFDQRDSVSRLADSDKTLTQMFYYGYPIQEEGYVAFVISENGCYSYTNANPGKNPLFDMYNYPQIFHAHCRDIKKQYMMDYGIDLGQIKELVLIEQVNGCVRNNIRMSEPYKAVKTNWNQLIPGAFVTDRMITSPNLRYPNQSQVLWQQENDTILSVECGSLCKVLRNGELKKNYSLDIEFLKNKSSNLTKIDPRIMNNTAKYHKVDPELLKRMGIMPKFYGVLWLLLESFIIQTDTSRDSYFILGQGFNMGLRIIDIFQIAPKFLGVPDLVKIIPPGAFKNSRMGSAKRSIYTYKIYKKLPRDTRGEFFEFDVRLTDQTVNLIKNYVNPANPKEHPYNRVLIDYMYNNYSKFFDKDHTLLRVPMFKATEIFNSVSLKDTLKTKDDPNMKLMDIYLWAISQEESSYPLMDSLSIIANRSTIRKIEEFVDPSTNKSAGLTKLSVDEASIVKLNKGTHLAIPPLSQHPPVHLPGDRVICLNYQFPSFVPFGMQATVVGIYKTQVEIVTDYPVIGGTSLGGRCSFFHGFTVSFEDVFNFKWKSFLMQSTRKDQYPWLMDLDLYLIRKEQTNEIIDADKRALAEKQQRHKEKEAPSYGRSANQPTKPAPKVLSREHFKKEAEEKFVYEPVYEAKAQNSQGETSSLSQKFNEALKFTGTNRNEANELEESKAIDISEIERGQAMGNGNGQASMEVSIGAGHSNRNEENTMSILDAISTKEMGRMGKKPSMLEKIKKGPKAKE